MTRPYPEIWFISTVGRSPLNGERPALFRSRGGNEGDR